MTIPAYPGLLCPGLIEADHILDSDVLPRGAYPGLLCPGLIEAAVGMREPSTIGDLSGASLPRPH